MNPGDQYKKIEDALQKKFEELEYEVSKEVLKKLFANIMSDINTCMADKIKSNEWIGNRVLPEPIVKKFSECKDQSEVIELLCNLDLLSFLFLELREKSVEILFSESEIKELLMQCNDIDYPNLQPPKTLDDIYNALCDAASPEDVEMKLAVAVSEMQMQCIGYGIDLAKVFFSNLEMLSKSEMKLCIEDLRSPNNRLFYHELLAREIFIKAKHDKAYRQYSSVQKTKVSSMDESVSKQFDRGFDICKKICNLANTTFPDDEEYERQYQEIKNAIELYENSYEVLPKLIMKQFIWLTKEYEQGQRVSEIKKLGIQSSDKFVGNSIFAFKKIFAVPALKTSSLETKPHPIAENGYNIWCDLYDLTNNDEIQSISNDHGKEETGEIAENNKKRKLENCSLEPALLPSPSKVAR